MNSLRSNSRLSGLELEREQLSLVKSIKMSYHEQLMEYVLFMIEFKRHLQNGDPAKPIQGKTYKWLHILVEYSKILGFPKEYVGWFKLARLNKSKSALGLVLDKAIVYFQKEMNEIRG